MCVVVVVVVAVGVVVVVVVVVVVDIVHRLQVAEHFCVHFQAMEIILSL